MYDNQTEFNSKTGKFECKFDGTPLNVAGGLFEAPDSPAASFAPVLTCPHCGHSIDIYAPSYALEATPEIDPVFMVRSEAVWMVQQAMYHLSYVGQAIRAWELEQCKSYRRAQQVERREAKRFALELAALKPARRNWFARLLGL